MKELFVLAGYLGVLLLFAWAIVFALERLLQKKESKRTINSEQEDDGTMMAAIVAAVEAYEQSFGREVKKVAVERVVYRRKVENISFWKLRGRVTQLLK
ncbi:MAG: hypothetical protein R3339_05550 [Thermodesulfobacteriota bacterium]|nr:hypothetical protein [Thermodesulfobacteriota bacterium]